MTGTITLFGKQYEIIEIKGCCGHEYRHYEYSNNNCRASVENQTLYGVIIDGKDYAIYESRVPLDKPISGMTVVEIIEYLKAVDGDMIRLSNNGEWDRSAIVKYSEVKTAEGWFIGGIRIETEEERNLRIKKYAAMEKERSTEASYELENLRKQYEKLKVIFEDV